MGVLPKGTCILTPSFIEIAPAVTKRALLTDDDDDDDDGRHVIAIADLGLAEVLENAEYNFDQCKSLINKARWTDHNNIFQLEKHSRKLNKLSEAAWH
jgi:hypothetical protein